MKRLSGTDALMLYAETPEVHMHTLKIGVLDVSAIGAGSSLEHFAEVAYPRLQALAPLRYRLIDAPLKLHHPMWMQDDDIDLDYHLRRVQLPPPGGRRALDQLIGQIASTPLDRTRPLWQMYLVEGLSPGRAAVIHKVHHVLADGIASANQMAHALGPLESLIPQPTPELLRWDGRRASLLTAAWHDHVGLYASCLALSTKLPPGSPGSGGGPRNAAGTDMARNFAPPPSFINHVVSSGRRFATAPLALSDVKQTAKHLGVTLNDIVLATAAGALRDLLLQYDGRADSPSLPVSRSATTPPQSG